MVSRGLQWCALGVLLAILISGSIVPAFRTLNSDFPNYYTVARVLTDHQQRSMRVYDWEWLQRRADEIGIRSVVSYLPNPPLCFAPVLPLARFEPLTAKRIWIAINVVLLVATVFLLARITEIPALTVGVIALACVIPLRTNFLLGQLYVLVLFLVVAALGLERKGLHVAAGAVVAAGAAIKVYPILFVFYFARKRRWTAAATLVGGWIASLLVGAAVFGVETVWTFIVDVLPRTPRGEIINPFDATSSSLTALLHRLFVLDPQLNAHPLVASTLAYSVLQPVCVGLILAAAVFCTRRLDEEINVDWAMWIVAMLAVSSMPVSYHFCLMVAVAVIVLRTWREHPIRLVAIFALYVLISMPVPKLAGESAWMAPLQMPRLIATLATLGLFIYCRREVFQRAGNIATCGALALVMATPGIASNVRYFSHADPWKSVGVANAAMNIDPAVAKAHLYYASMTAAGYVVRDGVGIQISPTGHNAFHPSVARNGAVWFEVFDGGRSRIASRRAGSTTLEYVTDGESPSVSPDGTWLAFVRGTKLWLRGPDGIERDVMNDGEVLEASVTDNDVVFSVQQGMTVSLFRKTLAGTDMPHEWIRGARYPAISADGRWLAYARHDRGGWHLWVANVQTGAQQRVTAADCNAITPTWSEGALYYSSDCNRGPGLTDLRQIPIEAALHGLR